MRPHQYHGIEPIEKWEAEISLRRSLWQAVVTTRQSLKDLYESLIILHPEIQNEMSFSKISRTMSRWRDKAILPEPTTFSATDELLNSDEWEFLRSYSVGPNDPRMLKVSAFNDQVMLIYDIDFIRELKLDRLYISTTTKIIPNISDAKFLTIVLGEMNEYAFPIIWVISTDYSRDTVKNIVLEIKNVLIKGHVMHFKEIYSDYFKDLQDHVDMEFHRVHEKKVSFDSICKVLRTAVHGIIDENNAETNQILRKIMTLTLLPFYLIDRELEKIGENLPNDGADGIKEFITYYEQKWKKDLLPSKYSIFEEVRAINDVPEIHLRVLKNSLQSENLSFWKFIESIGMNLAKHVKDCRKFRNSPDNYKINFTPRVNWSINNNRERSVSSGIKKLFQLLSEHRIDTSEYLERAVVVMRDHYNDFFFLTNICYRKN
ncbi:uncharacterized protein LOC141537250 [Cotesia typhae]|uniref:uncharacterized protein LOC141537250 n=1 Tax=Cotesia typhae TaxID=2053667 RepID=UPI003D69D991